MQVFEVVFFYFGQGYRRVNIVKSNNAVCSCCCPLANSNAFGHIRTYNQQIGLLYNCSILFFQLLKAAVQNGFAKRRMGHVAVIGIPWHIALHKCNGVPVFMQLAHQAAEGSSMAITPGRGNGQAKNYNIQLAAHAGVFERRSSFSKIRSNVAARCVYVCSASTRFKAALPISLAFSSVSQDRI